MSERCAFCPSTAKLSGEHLWSDWMNEYFPGKKRFVNLNTEKGLQDWEKGELDLTIKVVCESCNNGWMSREIEQNAKKIIGPLLDGNVDIPITLERARSIALFAFKTAAISDHGRRNYPFRFFSRDSRYRFKASLEIPATLQMWLAGYLPRTEGACFTAYYDVPEPDSLELYVCTYFVGHFVFQVVAYRHPVSWYARPDDTTFEDLAVPFWPRIPDGFLWPPKRVLMTPRELLSFANRWKRIHIFKPVGR